MAIWFDIDAQSGVPIFKQIIDQIKRAIATGLLKPDEQLPTVRELAEEHSINPNTVAKAYQNLELLGLVYTRPGLRGGTFIEREIAEGLRQLELTRFQETVRKLVQEGHYLGLEAAELNRQFQLEVTRWYSANPLPARPAYEGLTARPARKLSTTREVL